MTIRAIAFGCAFALIVTLAFVAATPKARVIDTARPGVAACPCNPCCCDNCVCGR